MFSHILVPLDGSARAERALPVAARIARSCGGRLLLVRAITLPVSYGLSYEEGRVQWHFMRDESETAQAYLDTVAQLPALAGLPVETLVTMGAPASMILDTCAERAIDLVVLTSHGQAGALRWMLGSVVSHVLHHSLAPILVLPARDEEEVAHERALEHRGAPAGSDLGDFQRQHALRVLLPLDGSPTAEVALAPAIELARALAGTEPVTMHLVLAVTSYQEAVSSTPKVMLTDDAQGYLERVAERVRAEWPDAAEASLPSITWAVLDQDDVASAILATATGATAGEGESAGTSTPSSGDGDTAAGPCDLIAMATHGYTGLNRWALGSVTERVLHATKLPILIVRPFNR